jgi:hypothetical protein
VKEQNLKGMLRISATVCDNREYKAAAPLHCYCMNESIELIDSRIVSMEFFPRESSRKLSRSYSSRSVGSGRSIVTLCLDLVMSRNEGFLSINTPFGGMVPEDTDTIEGVLCSGGGNAEEAACWDEREIVRCRRGGGGDRLVYESCGTTELEGPNDNSRGGPCARLKLGAELALDKRDALRGCGELEPIAGGEPSPADDRI